jgi:hypothetical protein
LWAGNNGLVMRRAVRLSARYQPVDVGKLSRQSRESDRTPRMRREDRAGRKSKGAPAFLISPSLHAVNKYLLLCAPCCSLFTAHYLVVACSSCLHQYIIAIAKAIELHACPHLAFTINLLFVWVATRIHFIRDTHVHNLIQSRLSNNIPQLHNMYTPSPQIKLLIYRMRTLALT